MQPNNKAHFVSVVIPVLNEALHVEKCLNSISAQDYPASNIEILVVDGMSDDGTRDIIKRLCQEAKDRGMLIDASFGRKTKAVLLMDTDHVILCAVTPEALAARLEEKEAP